jgi:FkbM family methyltransferase
MMEGSQLGQDKAVLDFYAKYSDDGERFFVDIGAFDGVNYSNTWRLEQAGWTGICAEPLESCWGMLTQMRKKSYCSNKAITDRSGMKVAFADCSGSGKYPAYTGMVSGIKTFGQGEYLDYQKASPTVFVDTQSLNDLLVEGVAPAFIEYLSLDVEGAELTILSAFDFSRWTFGLIDVEHNYTADRPRIRALLEANGYVWMRENEHDDCYCHASLLPKTNV